MLDYAIDKRATPPAASTLLRRQPDTPLRLPLMFSCLDYHYAISSPAPHLYLRFRFTPLMPPLMTPHLRRAAPS